MNRIMLSRHLSKLGYRSSLIENGRQVLGKLQANTFEPESLVEVARCSRESVIRLEQEYHRVCQAFDAEGAARHQANNRKG